MWLRTCSRPGRACSLSARGGRSPRSARIEALTSPRTSPAGSRRGRWGLARVPVPLQCGALPHGRGLHVHVPTLMTVSLDVSILSTRKLLLKLGLNSRGLFWLLRRPPLRLQDVLVLSGAAFCPLGWGRGCGLCFQTSDAQAGLQAVVCARVSLCEVCVRAVLCAACVFICVCTSVVCARACLHVSVCGVWVWRVSVCVHTCLWGVCVQRVLVCVTCTYRSVSAPLCDMCVYRSELVCVTCACIGLCVCGLCRG